MNIWNFIKDKLIEEKSIYLMINIQSIGSSPGKQGFAMAVCSDGILNGSIGGGAMEFRLVENCKEMLKANKLQIFKKRQVHRGNVEDGSGMICSGEQTIAFIPLIPSRINLVTSITSCLNENSLGVLKISPKGFSFNLSDKAHDEQYQCSILDNNWSYNEVIGYKSTLYIAGAGHVGFAVSKLFSQLGFKIVLFDNRTYLGMLNDNTYADEKLVIDYKDIADYILDSNSSYVVIMTNNHKNDKEVLSLLIRKKVRYLGLMGSKEKLAGIMKSMNEIGFTNDELRWVHAPIGISINSKTPDEIAISIAAEIIGVKNAN
ncbi:MAG: XdhC family protein [Bacteroidota bacterium]